HPLIRIQTEPDARFGSDLVEAAAPDDLLEDIPDARPEFLGDRRPPEGQASKVFGEMPIRIEVPEMREEARRGVPIDPAGRLERIQQCRPADARSGLRDPFERSLHPSDIAVEAERFQRRANYDPPDIAEPD